MLAGESISGFWRTCKRDYPLIRITWSFVHLFARFRVRACDRSVHDICMYVCISNGILARERNRKERQTYFIFRVKKRGEVRREGLFREDLEDDVHRTSCGHFGIVIFLGNVFNEPMLPRIYRAHDQRRSSQDVRITCTELRSDAIRARFLHEKERERE